jgi:hypothetical protein
MPLILRDYNSSIKWMIRVKINLKGIGLNGSGEGPVALLQKHHYTSECHKMAQPLLSV